MNLVRRRWILHLAGGLGVTPGALAGARGTASLPAPASDPVRRSRPIAWPRDHGAHPGAAIEWWYATGWLGETHSPTHGFQLTFFRSRTGLAEDARGRFAARQLLFAHAAVTDLARGRHLHDDRVARWSGDPDAPLAHAALDDCRLRLGHWTLRRDAQPASGSRHMALLQAPDFTLDLTLERTQPVLLQGDAGFSRKGPEERQASHYYSEPQMAVNGRLRLQGRDVAASGRAWLDHEWSNELLHPDAVGWDWIGMNLFDGSALTVFQLRRADGRALWAGGSWRAPGQAAQSFAHDAVRMQAGRTWTSAATQARYPLQWQVLTPAGRFEVRALLDAQELDSRASTGTVYWEGLSELRDAGGRRVGLGYLELTGYERRLSLGSR